MLLLIFDSYFQSASYVGGIVSRNTKNRLLNKEQFCFICSVCVCVCVCMFYPSAFDAQHLRRDVEGPEKLIQASELTFFFFPVRVEQGFQAQLLWMSFEDSLRRPLTVFYCFLTVLVAIYSLFQKYLSAYLVYCAFVGNGGE